MLEQPTQKGHVLTKNIDLNNLIIIEIDLSVWPHPSVCSQFGLILRLRPTGHPA